MVIGLHRDCTNAIVVATDVFANILHHTEMHASRNDIIACVSPRHWACVTLDTQQLKFK